MITIVPGELDLMVHWIHERDRIRAAKEDGAPKPWTTDHLLRDYRWCNVRRMDDRVSRELFERWYRADADRQTSLAAAVLGRLINWPESLLEITEGAPFSVEHLQQAGPVLRGRAARGEKVFTGAYLIPPGRPAMEGDAAPSKIEHVIGLAELFATESYSTITGSMRGTWSQITKWDGMGSFLAGQVVADLVHLAPGRQWTDPPAWAPIGPGSARGINRLRGIHKDKPVAQADFERLLPKLIDVLRPRIDDVWRDRGLQAMDIQNCLCEFDKYRRLQLGEGKVRARYDGAGAQASLL